MDVAIIGASGYGGGELLRLLAMHPHARVVAATSNTYAGRRTPEVFPGLGHWSDVELVPDEGASSLAGVPLVFLARDNGYAMRVAPNLIEGGARLIDLSADFRFRDAAVYPQWYGLEHASPHLLAEAVYGLPELHRLKIRSARLVGNPGCYTTASILALAPLLARRDEGTGTFTSDTVIDPATVIVDAKSGVSGAGRAKPALEYRFAEANEAVSAYKVAGTHRHTPEIEAELTNLLGTPVRVSFTPHLIPMTRGILTTCYATLAASLSEDDLRARFRDFYAGEPFVLVMDGLPSTKHALGSNLCLIGVAVDRRTGRVIVVSALDNLVKGMAGQAIQNMNVMCGWDEEAGLRLPGMWP
ncbi:MAG: N-acetyl-gamma-glutamyl-phosphate reductase [Chthonomonadales bacterium]